MHRQTTRPRHWARCLAGTFFLLTRLLAIPAAMAEDPPGDPLRADRQQEAQDEMFRARLAKILGASDGVVVGHLSRAILADPDLQSAYRGRICLDCQREDWSAIVRDALQLERLTPTDAMAWLMAGAAYNNLRDYRAAIRHLTQAFEMADDDQLRQTAACFRGLAEMFSGKAQRALDDFDLAAGLVPHDRLEPLLNRAIVALVFQTSGEAASADTKVFDDAVAGHPLLSEPLQLRAVYHFRSGRYAEFLADLERALQLDSRNVELLCTLANVLARDKGGLPLDLPRAERLARRACELSDWQNSLALEALAYVKSQQGDYRAAFEFERMATYRERGAEFDPQQPTALRFAWDRKLRTPNVVRVAARVWSRAD